MRLPAGITYQTEYKEEHYHMTDYTHKRYLVKDRVTGSTRTVIKKVGSNRYEGGLRPTESVVACLGGFRSVGSTGENMIEEVDEA